MFRGEHVEESRAFARADHRAAYKQLPVCEECERLDVEPLGGPNSIKMRDPILQTQLFGATAAAWIYNSVSRVMAGITARWLKLVRMGCFGDFGIISMGVLCSGGVTSFYGFKCHPRIRFGGRKI